jgi:4-diphosphocytidyl-2-C-methyl-D-erythritol kinase
MVAKSPLKVRAFAKINLGLRVLGLRPDGYHELRTVFQSIALHDTLTVSRARGAFRLECDDPSCPSDQRNLVWQAAERMWDAARRRGALRDVVVRLQKRIPAEAGLGGGSSDAAAALRALAALWRVKLTRDDLHRMASELGADVPYFLEGGTAFGLDRGDLLLPLVDMPLAWVTLVIPSFGVSTKDAFAWWDEQRGNGLASQGRRDRGPVRSALQFANDLQEPVARRHPVVPRLVRRLEREGATRAALSGSGSAVFGLFERRPEAQRAAQALAGRHRRTLVTRTLTRSECLQALAAK